MTSIQSTSSNAKVLREIKKLLKPGADAWERLVLLLEKYSNEISEALPRSD